MTELIRQRSMTDCGICCLAMALGRAYEDILAQAPEYQARAAAGDRRGIFKDELWRIIRGHGHGLRHFYRYWLEDNGGDFWKELRRQRTILQVESLNVPGGWHIVYWDGKQLLDPSNLKTYTRETIPRNAFAQIILPMIAAG